MKQKRVAILGAVREETAGLRRRIRWTEKFKKGKILAGSLGGREVLLAETGVGPERSARMTRFLLDHFTIDYFLSTGYAGGLKGSLKAGDLLICDRAYCTEGESGFRERKAHPLAAKSLDREKTAEAMRRLSGIRAQKANILTVRSVMGSAAEKKWVGEVYPVHAVDMETFAVVREAETRGVPVIALRAVSDAADEALIPVLNLVDKNGEVSRVRAGLYAILHPGAIPRLLSLREHTLKASRVLTEAVLKVL